MLKLEKDDALGRLHLANKARKKIPLYSHRNDIEVKVPFLDVRKKLTRYVLFRNIEGRWAFIELVG
jgi:hypothetical protein